jgi:hypothetical protein
MRAGRANSQHSQIPPRPAILTLSQLPHRVTLYKHLFLKYNILNKISFKV